jgi:hypothetical protein
MGNELEVYSFSFKLRSDRQLQVQYFSQKWHITENLERWNLGKINENKFSAHQTSRIGPKPIKYSYLRTKCGKTMFPHERIF